VDIGERYLKFFFRFAGEYKILFVIRKGDIIHKIFAQSLMVQSKPKTEAKSKPVGIEKVKSKKRQDIYSEEPHTFVSTLSPDKNSNPAVTNPRDIRNVLYDKGLPTTKEATKLRKTNYSDKKAGVPINRVTEDLVYVEETEETEETEDMDDTCDSISDNNNFTYTYTYNVPEVIDGAQINYLPTTPYYYVQPNTTSWLEVQQPTQAHFTFEEKGEGFLAHLLEPNKNEKLLDFNTQPPTTYYSKHIIEANNNNITKNTAEIDSNNLDGNILQMDFYLDSNLYYTTYNSTQM